MACEAITTAAYWNELTGMFDHEVWRQFWPRSPRLTLIRRGTWPDHIGKTVSSQVYGRNAPSVADPTWQPVTAVVDGAEGGLCLPVPEKVVPGFNTRSYYVSRRALIGPDFCAENLRSTWETEQQAQAIVDALGQRVQLEWEMLIRKQYFTHAMYKVVCQDPLVYNTNWTDSLTATTYPSAGQTCPTSRLTWGFLDYFRTRLLQNGAHLSAIGQENNSPVLTVLTDDATIQQLRLDAQGDLRFGAPSKLLAPFGQLGSLRGYYLLDDIYPRRFECVGGTYTQVAPFILDATAQHGEIYKVNPAWQSATYTETQIWDSEVYHQLIPNPFTNAGAGITFNPVNYTGVYRLLNIPDRVCNPLGNIVFHHCLMACADMPVHPERGVSLIHLRCDPALNGTACNTPQS